MYVIVYQIGFVNNSGKFISSDGLYYKYENLQFPSPEAAVGYLVKNASLVANQSTKYCLTVVSAEEFKSFNTLSFKIKSLSKPKRDYYLDNLNTLQNNL